MGVEFKEVIAVTIINTINKYAIIDKIFISEDAENIMFIDPVILCSCVFKKEERENVTISLVNVIKINWLPFFDTILNFSLEARLTI